MSQAPIPVELLTHVHERNNQALLAHGLNSLTATRQILATVSQEQSVKEQLEAAIFELNRGITVLTFALENLTQDEKYQDPTGFNNRLLKVKGTNRKVVDLLIADIENKEGLTQREMSDRLSVHQGSISSFLHKLLDFHYIERLGVQPARYRAQSKLVSYFNQSATGEV